MSEINEFDDWARRLEGEDVGCEDGKPQSGYYRGSADQPVAIWRNGDRFVAKVGLRTITDDLRVLEVWERCHARPVSYEDWQAVAEREEPWPDKHPVVSEMPRRLPTAFELLRADIERLVSEAERMALPAADEDEAARAGDLASKLGDLEKKADAQRRDAKKPHEEAGKAVDAQWRPIVEAASNAKRNLKARVVEPFLKAKAEAARTAAAAVGADHDGKAKTKGGRVALRRHVVVTVESPAEALRWFASLNDVPRDLVDAAETVARRMANAGVTNIPGVVITVEQRAA